MVGHRLWVPELCEAINLSSLQSLCQGIELANSNYVYFFLFRKLNLCFENF